MKLSDTTKQFIGNIKVTDLLSNSTQKELENVVALISPHAGYYYSGNVAAIGFNQIEDKYDNVFIIATSHKTTFKGISILNDIDYDGSLVNQEISNELEKNEFFFKDIDLFKDDHNLEIQLPFLREKLPGIPIIPLMVGETNIDNLITISETLKPYFNGKNLFVISSDFSHFPSYEDAIKVDYDSIKTIMDLNLENLNNYINSDINMNGLVTKMCGWSSIIILVNILTQLKGIKSKMLLYQNSGHVTNDKSSVVGYSSIVFTNEEEEFKLSYSDKIDLMKISRNTLDSYIKYGITPQIEREDLSDNLRTNMGSFVTIKKNGELKGCIGIFSPNYRLCDVVKNMTISSTQDNRFENIQESELNDIEIEISVLTPYKKINSIEEFELGKHGIYIEKNGNSGTFLPQVATETGWSKEEFFGQCSQSKANIGWDGWKDANLYTYEAIVFNENELLKEASYYEKLDDNKVKCNLCPHFCKISDGKIGNCISRKNIDGKLYSLGYNNPGVIGAVDPIEKKPLRHFHPGKMIYSLSCNGCNFHCDNCQNDGISQIKNDKFQNIEPIEIINDCKNRGLDMIAFTYTEPTIYFEYMLDIAKIAKENNIKTVMVSNGYINPEPLKELIPYIDAVNIDLKTFDSIIHKKITKGGLKPVLNTIKTLFDSGVHIEITNLIIEDLTDNEDTINEMYQWIVDNGMKDVPIHIIRFFPRFKMMERKETSIGVVDKIKEIALNKGILNVYT